ncbi:putative Late embryogenesis abundant protein, LEA_3 subgroup [Helianthus annuus]|nr:putative Late embryogenesis abundant protein, LEA_3 subgroup [Helianthus annuus]
MARIVSSFIVNHLSVVARRGYGSASSQGVVSEGAKGSVVAMMKKGSEESKKSSAWIPDPVTGYYKPEGHGNQIDPAELREMLLKHKTRQN